MDIQFRNGIETKRMHFLKMRVDKLKRLRGNTILGLFSSIEFLLGLIVFSLIISMLSQWTIDGFCELEQIDYIIYILLEKRL